MVRNQAPKKHGGKPHDARRSLGMKIRFRTDDAKIDPDLFDRTAKAAAVTVANCGRDRNKGTQLRRFYDELVMWEEKARQNNERFDEYLPFIRMLKAKAAYAEGRKLVDGAFVDLLEQAVDAVGSADDLRVIKLFFEAFLGFYKLEKGD
ncbi:MAG TPA: type III-A CRISPR-associated protein Csm2 [Sedimenticola sp.]|nr:type III-A CRISPR-associated protein Csm2 [Sedimenticola sp.]